MTKLYYLRGALGDARLLEEHEESIGQLLRGDYSAGNLEKLQGHDVFSYRLSDKARLLFAVHRFEDRPCLVILDYLPTHDYHKSRFLRPGVLKNYLERQEADNRGVNELNFVPHPNANRLPVFTAPDEANPVPELAVADYYQQSLISLNLEQQEAFRIQLPALVSGVAGSGKSCVALSLLTEHLSKHPRSESDAHHPLLYVSKSKALVDSMRRAWSELPIAQDVPADEVFFMTYDELLCFEAEIPPGVTLVGEESFASWYSSKLTDARTRGRATGKEAAQTEWPDASIVYQEFRIASGYAMEAYQQLGVRQSLLKDQTQRIWLYSLYQKYQSFLEQHHQIHSEFYSFRPKRRYDLVVSDESQDLSYRQLLQLGQCAPGSIVFCMDSHQSLHDRRSVRPFLLQNFGISDRSHIELNRSHRCPLRVVTAANAVIALKHRLTGGLADKREPTRIDSTPSVHHLGHVFVMPPEDVLANLWLKTQASEAHCAIVTAAEHLQEAQRYFSNSLLVFTPETIKGLEYDVVIAWKLYRPGFMVQVRHQALSLGDAPIPEHRAKAGLGAEHFGPDLNQIYTAYTRAKQVLIISEERSHNNKPLLEPLSRLADSGVPSEASVQQELLSGDWEKEALRQLEVGNEGLALTIFKSKLGRSEAQFREFIARHHQKPVIRHLKVTTEEFKQEPSTESKKPEDRRTAPYTRLLPETTARAIGATIKSTAPKIHDPAQNSKQHSVSSLASHVVSLANDFSAKRLRVVLSLYEDNKSIWLKPYTNVDGKEFVLADLLCDNSYWGIVTQILVGDSKLLLKTPLQEILIYLSARFQKGKLDDLGVLILTQNLVLKEQNKLGAVHSPLELAVLTKNIPLIHRIHKLGANLDTPNATDETPAYIAATWGHVSVLRVLKQLGANLHLPNARGATPIFIAAGRGRLEALRVLSEFGANLNSPGQTGVTPAFFAAEMGKADALRVLKELGANLDLPNDKGATPAHIAAQMGHVEVLLVLKKFGANLNLHDKWTGATPAHYAAEHGQVEVLRILEKLGADLELFNANGITPVHIAVHRGQVEVLRLLKKLGANLDLPERTIGATPVYIAAQTGQVEVIRVLKELGANLDLPNADGATPAYIAAQKGQVEVLRVLKELGASLDLTSADGSTLAFIAAQTGQVEVIRVLKELGANLDLPNANGATPAYIAAQKGQVEVLRVLKELGANLDISKADGLAPVHVAVHKGQRVLKELGANLDLPNSRGATPIFIAAQMGKTEVVRLLITLGVDYNLKFCINKNGLISFGNNKSEEIQERIKEHLDVHKDEEPILLSPLHIAQIMGHNDIVQLLLVSMTEPTNSRARHLFFSSPIPGAPYVPAKKSAAELSWITKTPNLDKEFKS